MKIAIAGATGFLGSALTKELRRQNHTVVPIPRRVFDAHNVDELRELIYGSQVVVNLAGWPIMRRWTRRYRDKLYRSRVEVTELLVAAINSAEELPELFISSSAIGCYPSDGVCSESADRVNSGFISWLCHRWEVAAEQIVPQVRLAIVRIAPVIAKKGGFMSRLLRLLNYRVSLQVGDDKSLFSWIHIGDFVSAMLFIIDNRELSGVVNLSAPGITTNSYMASSLSKARSSSVVFKVPGVVLRALLGPSKDLLLSSKAVYPAALLEHGFHFRYPYIKSALENIAER